MIQNISFHFQTKAFFTKIISFVALYHYLNYENKRIYVSIGNGTGGFI
uniref:Uncharacterized protein n=1 Tax=Anguilla anguilla TaxID=7936 RepID=A0A0E9WMQ5_ANGAN